MRVKTKWNVFYTYICAFSEVFCSHEVIYRNPGSAGTFFRQTQTGSVPLCPSSGELGGHTAYNSPVESINTYQIFKTACLCKINMY